MNGLGGWGSAARGGVCLFLGCEEAGEGEIDEPDEGDRCIDDVLGHLPADGREALLRRRIPDGED